MSWYLRSLADADTHLGSYSPVTRSVHALCGVEFVPRELPLGGPALPSNPLDPARSAHRAAASSAPGQRDTRRDSRVAPGGMGVPAAHEAAYLDVTDDTHAHGIPSPPRPGLTRIVSMVVMQARQVARPGPARLR